MARHLGLPLLLAVAGCTAATPPPNPTGSPPEPSGDGGTAVPSGGELDGCTVVADGCELNARGDEAMAFADGALWTVADAKLWRLPLGKDVAEAVRPLPGVIRELVVTTKFAFVADGLGVAPKPLVVAYPLDGKEPTTVIHTDGIAFGESLVLYGDRLTWAASSGGVNIFGVAPTDGKTGVTLGGFPGALAGLALSNVAAHGDELFYAVAGDRLFRAAGTDLGPATELFRTADGAAITTVLRDADTVLVVAGSKLFAMPTSGGEARLVGALNGAERIRAIDGWVYWRTTSVKDMRATYWTMPVAGGAPRVLLSRPESTGAYAVGGGFFFGSGRSPNADGKSVVRVTLPR